MLVMPSPACKWKTPVYFFFHKRGIGVILHVQHVQEGYKFTLTLVG